MFGKQINNVLLVNLFFAYVRASGLTDFPQDQTTHRANTLFDDADDIQKQLDNEARDRMKYGKTKNIWVFHLPTQFPGISTETYRRPRDSDVLRRRAIDASFTTEYLLTASDVNENKWIYEDQKKWGELYPDCLGRSQSPVDLPYEGFLKVKGARKILFKNHDILPKSLNVVHNERGLKLSGTWPASKRPVIYGGAAHSRRYVFDSITVHWPSEHTIGGRQYPLESQALYVSAEYGSANDALHATNDKMAILSVANLYKFSNKTHKGLQELLNAALTKSYNSITVSLHPLSYINPPFKEYVCYHGSLTTPPCTESVLWLVRATSLPITRDLLEALQDISVNGEPQQFVFRQTQALNDRKIYFFH